MPDHTEPDQNLPEPANLRFLRRLVTILTATMIFGILGIFALLVMRLNQATSLPDFNITLPDGVAVHSYSVTEDRHFVVGSDRTLYIFDPDKTLLQSVPLR